MLNKVKSLVSYVHPVMIEARSGNVTPYLEVTKLNGRYTLNSHKANYSYGGLNIIFKDFFKKIKIENYQLKNILVLGMGAGNVVSMIRDTYRITCPITAVEMDSIVIDLAKEYFNISAYKNLTIVNDDAFHYAAVSDQKFDLIISDLFIDNDVPKIFASPEYIRNLKRLSSDKCIIAYNKMTEDEVHKEELVALTKEFEAVFGKIEVMKLYANHSENSIMYSNSFGDK